MDLQRTTDEKILMGKKVSAKRIKLIEKAKKVLLVRMESMKAKIKTVTDLETRLEYWNSAVSLPKKALDKARAEEKVACKTKIDEIAAFNMENEPKKLKDYCRPKIIKEKKTCRKKIRKIRGY